MLRRWVVVVDCCDDVSNKKTFFASDPRTEKNEHDDTKIMASLSFGSMIIPAGNNWDSSRIPTMVQSVVIGLCSKSANTDTGNVIPMRFAVSTNASRVDAYDDMVGKL